MAQSGRALARAVVAVNEVVDEKRDATVQDGLLTWKGTYVYYPFEAHPSWNRTPTQPI